MLSRYIKQNEVLKTNTGVRYYATNISNTVPEDIFKYFIVAQDGDRFDLLASKFYNDPAKWWIIAKANNLVNGTMFIQGGTKIFIPSVGLK